jgi:hypothetical protein
MPRIATQAALAALCLLASACSPGGRTVATVDGRRITDRDVVAEMSIERGLYDPAILRSEANFTEFRRQALDRLIQETVLVAEARRAGISPGKAGEGPMAEIEKGAALSGLGIEAKRWKASQERRALIGRLIEQEVVGKIPVEQSEVEAYYKKNLDGFREPASFHARQMLVDTKEEADRIHARLMKGDDFGELAKEFSQSPDAARGGDLGYFDAKAFP